MFKNLTKQEKAWVLYDVGNSAFTMLACSLIPIWFKSLAIGTNPGQITKDQATAYYSIAIAVVTVVVALMGPILGAIADHKDTKKIFFTTAVALGVIGCIINGFAGNQRDVPDHRITVTVGKLLSYFLHGHVFPKRIGPDLYFLSHPGKVTVILEHVSAPDQLRIPFNRLAAAAAAETNGIIQTCPAFRALIIIRQLFPGNLFPAVTAAELNHQPRLAFCIRTGHRSAASVAAVQRMICQFRSAFPAFLVFCGLFPLDRRSALAAAETGLFRQGFPAFRAGCVFCQLFPGHCRSAAAAVAGIAVRPFTSAVRTIFRQDVHRLGDCQ